MHAEHPHGAQPGERLDDAKRAQVAAAERRQGQVERDDERAESHDARGSERLTPISIVSLRSAGLEP